jgi:hypothetical protein
MKYIYKKTIGMWRVGRWEFGTSEIVVCMR